MTVIDLIMELSQLDGELEVIYDGTQEGDDGFRMIVVENLGEIQDDKGDHWILLNCDNYEQEVEEGGM